jgi:hypothetical protein
MLATVDGSGERKPPTPSSVTVSSFVKITVHQSRRAHMLAAVEHRTKGLRKERRPVLLWTISGVSSVLIDLVTWWNKPCLAGRTETRRLSIKGLKVSVCHSRAKRRLGIGCSRQ